jgi:hypothetical protein
MLATGWAGVAAAALALVGGVAVIGQPNDDPLAIFERAATERDGEWETRLLESGVAAVTLGPRVVDFADGRSAIAFRSAAVGDGTSTEWDPYCIVISDPNAPDDRPWVSGGACVSPEQFARDGLIAPLGTSTTGTGIDRVLWGPVGGPRLERNGSFEFSDTFGESVIDRMVYPDADTSFLDDPSRLLMGPVTLLAGEAADESFVLASAYLVSGDDRGDEPTFCVYVGANDGTSSTACAALSAVRLAGIDVPLSAGGNTWTITIDPDGPNRMDSLALLEG